MKTIFILLFLSAIFIASMPLENADQVYSVDGEIGENVELPCNAEQQNCGKIYYTSWLKWTTEHWETIYVFSYQSDKNLETPRNRTKFFMDRSSSDLHVKSLSMDDAGRYKCQVTYSQQKCPSTFYVNLAIKSEGKQQRQVLTSWTDWSEWSSCNSRGEQHRERTCRNLWNSPACEGHFRETKQCSDIDVDYSDSFHDAETVKHADDSGGFSLMVLEMIVAFVEITVLTVVLCVKGVGYYRKRTRSKTYDLKAQESEELTSDNPNVKSTLLTVHF